MRRIAVALAVILVAATAVPWLRPEPDRHRRGRRPDEQGGALPGVTVTLAGKTGTRARSPTPTGDLPLPGLDPGTYTVTAELSGFRTKRQENVVVTIGQAVRSTSSLGGGRPRARPSRWSASRRSSTRSAAPPTTRCSQDLLFNLPIRPSNAATDLLNYLPGINDGSAYGGDSDTAQRAAARRRRHPRPRGRLGLDLLQLQHRRGGPGERPRRPRRVRRLHRRGGQHRSPSRAATATRGLFDVYYTNEQPRGRQRQPTRSSRRTPRWRTRPRPTSGSTSPPSSAGPIVKDKLFFFLSAQRYHRDAGPDRARAPCRNEVSPRFNLKLTWQPERQRQLHRASSSTTTTTSSAAAASPPRSCTDDLTNREDAPEWVWALQWRHLFGSKTFSEVKYNGWTGFYDLNPEVNEPGRLRRRDRGSTSTVAGLVLLRRPQPQPGERLDLPLRRGLRQARPEVRRRDRAQQGAQPLRVRGHSSTTTTPPTTRAGSTTPTPTATTSGATTSASRSSPRTPGTSTTG